jgi:hypothetical protein
MTQTDLYLQYKSETGNDVKIKEVGGYRRNGVWYLSISDEEMLEIFGCNFSVEFPDMEYIKWLEGKLEQC